MARIRPEISAGSMADIAFLLLIFFLVTASLNVETGIRRRLPPIPEKEQENILVKKRNVFEVLINDEGMLLVNGNPTDIRMLRQVTVDFISNPADDPEKPEKQWLSEMEKRERSAGNFAEADKLKSAIKLIGDYPVSKGIISLQSDRATPYKSYIDVQNELSAAINQLRDALSKEKFGTPYSRLSGESRKMAIRKAIPLTVSEAEPHTNPQAQ
jgi:biopolymer transport protein ExbD